MQNQLYNVNETFINKHLIYKGSILAYEAGRTNIEFASSMNLGNASLGQFPWHALISSDASSICGGSLILPNWVLTAAQCIG